MLRPRPAVVLIAAALCHLPAAVGAQDADLLAVDLPPLTTWELDNGLRIAHMHLEKSPVVTVQVWYHAGSKDEPPNKRGSAHMFEHMMFKGSTRVRPEAHAQELSRLGGRVNAFTVEDATAYHNTLPAPYMDFAMQLEAERMRNLLFRDEMITTEKQVVLEEIRQQENSPLYQGMLRFLKIAYAVHPYAWTAAGSLADLNETTVADLRTFYDSYYQPNNALLIVVGSVPEATVRESAQRFFGEIARGPEPPRPAAKLVEPEQTEARREVLEPAHLGLVITGYHVPRHAHADTPALEVLSLILGSGQSSRLYEQLVRKGGLARDVGGELLAREDPGLMLLFAAFLDPSKAGAVESALQSEVARLHKSAPTAVELRKAKNQLTASYAYGLESVTGLANLIGSSWINTGDPQLFSKRLQEYQQVTAADVRRVAAKYLRKENSTHVVIPPQSEAAPK